MVNYNQIGTNDIEMTNYDIFMMNKNKKKAENKLFGRRDERPVDISYEKYKKKFIKEKQRSSSCDYKTYLMEQLERKSPERIMTEEEFYAGTNYKPYKQQVVHSTNVNNRVKSEKANKPSIMSAFLKKLFGNVEVKKGAKIFIAFYVLIVIAVASILIVMNTATSSNINSADAKTGENTASEIVQPMVIQEEESNQDWFDKLCDSLNK